MSRTVDERVVSMQFDNRNFERNAKESMSTLDKLKQKLNLSGAAKGLNEVDSAAKKVNFNPLGNAVESVKVKFSAFEVMAVTALTNITNKAVNAGEQLLKSLTIDNVTAGWSKYEQKTASVQTILNATGKSIDEVNAYLDKLMWFSDETSYGFTDMTKALATMTSAGGDIDKLIPMIMGVANATAFAGKGAAEFSQIMQYGINQAYSLGHMQVRDWQSIENATVGSKQLKEILIQSAEELGKIEKGSIAVSQFRETLADKWLDKDVMEAGFGKFAEMSEKAFQMVENGEVETASEAYEKLSSQYSGVSIQAAKAAQEAKTFTEAIDATKDAVSSGWMKSFEIIFGNYEKAKELWTDLANFLWDVFASGADRRNEMLEMAFGGVTVSKVFEKLKSITDTATEAIDKVTDLGKVVDDVINGKYGNTEERWNKLTEEGYDWIRVQNLVNEKLGCTYRRQESVAEATDEATESTKDLKDATDDLSDAMLKEIGLTEEEIEIFRKLQDISKRTGIPLEEINGRMLLLEGIKNIGKSIIDVFKQVKNAWSDTFAPLRAVHLLNIIDMFHRFSESLKVNHDTSYKLYRTFKGLFAIIDLVATITGGAFRIAFAIVKELFKYFNIDILDVTAAIGDAAVKLRNWLKSLINVEAVVEVIGPLIERAVNAIRSFVNNIKESKAFQTFADRVRSVTTAIREWFAGMKDAENLPQYIANGIGTAIGYVLKFARDLLKNLVKFITGGFKDIPGFMADGFVGGLGAGIKKVSQGMLEFGKTIINRVKEILGIHSPSKVFFAIGGFAVAGFILGFRDKIGEVFPALGEFADTVVNFIKNIDFGKLFATAGSVAMLAFAKSMMDVAGGITEVLEGVGTVLISFSYTMKQFGTASKRISKGVKHALDAMAFQQLAIAIAILVGSVVVLTLIDPDKLWNAVKVIAALAGIMAALFVVCNLNLNFSKVSLGSEKTLIEFGKMAAGLFALGASILLVAIAAKMIADIDPEAFERAKSGLLFIAVIMVGMMAATQLMAKSTSSAQTLAGSTKTTTTIAAIGATLIQMAAALLILVVAAKMISGMDWSEMAKAAAGLLFLGGIMVGLMAATKLLAKTKAGSINAGLMTAGKMLLSMAAAMLVMSITAKIIAGMSWSDMAKAGVGLLALAGLLVGLVAATQLIVKTAKGGLSTQITKIGTMLLSMALAIGVLVLAAKIIAGMSWEEIAKAGVGLTVLSGLIVGLVAATKLVGGKDLKGVAVTLLSMALVIGAMVAAVLVMSLIDTSALTKGLIAVSVFGAIIAGLLAASKSAGDAKASLIGLAIAVAVMAAAIAVLSFIDPSSLASATAAMSMVMGMFALMTSQAGKAQKCLPGLITMIGAVAIIAGLLILLTECSNANEALVAAIAISLVLAALVVSFQIMSKVSKSAVTKALWGVAGMLLMMVPLMALIVILHEMPDVSRGLQSMPGVIAVMTALTILLLITAAVGAIYSATGGWAATGLAGLLVMIGLIWPLVWTINGIPDVSAGIPNIQKVVELMAVMTDLLVKLAIIGPLAIIGVGALASLTGLMVAIGLLATGVGLVADQVGPLLDKGIPLLIKLAEGLGQMIGSFVKGMLVSISAGLPEIGSNLTTFMDNAQGFINGAKQVDGKVLDGVSILAGAILALVAVDLISGIASLLQFGSSFSSLGSELSIFAMSALPFITIMKTVDTSVCEGVKAIADMILTLSAAGIKESIASFISGKSSIVDFGLQLIPFGQCLKVFSDTVAGVSAEAVRAAAEAGKALADMASIIPNQGGVAAYFAGDNSLASFAPQIVIFGQCMKSFSDAVTGMNVEAVTAAAKAGKVLAEMASIIPNQGGVASWFAGDNSLASFAPQIAKFGYYLKMFSDNVAGINPENATAAAKAGKTLAEMASIIPNQGGVASWFAGDNSLGAFAPQIAKFGYYLKMFSDNVAGINPENVTAAANSGKTIAEMASIIPNQGGVTSWFAGDNSLGKFAPQIASFGKHLKSFSDNVVGINPENITAAAEAGKNLAKMADTVPNQGGIKSWFSGDNSISAFGGKIAAFGKHLKSFSDNVAGVNPKNIAAAAEAGKNLAQMASTVPSDVNIATFGVQLVSFGKSMESFSKQVSGIKVDALTTTVNAFKDAMKKIADIGKDGVNGFIDAFKNAKSDAAAAATEMVKAALKGAKSTNLRSEFQTVGKQCVEGFAAGITANTFLAQARAVAMCLAALEAARAALRINSPSKVFRDMGMSVPEGFAMGIDKLGGMVKDSAVDMADGAIDGTRTAIARIADAINSDIDTQPTIRPVLDLSDVQAGANSLSGMLAMTPSVGVMANVGAISSMMNNRQNGGNDDVVSALNDLKSSLSGRTGDSYTINGITYDDGTNVSTAVKELVRAARIERRV